VASTISSPDPHPAPSAWPDRIRLPMRFAPEPLAAAIAGLAETDWTRHFIRDNFEGLWSAVPLRAGRRAVHPIQMIYADPTETEWIDTRFLAAMPAIRDVLDALPCPLGIVRLMRLTPGSIIKPHCDPDLDIDLGRARLHIPIATGPEVEFKLNGRRVDMEPGSVWYLRLADTHEVANRGDSDRVHLVIDTSIDDWLLARLREGVAAMPA
jgi:hypothetical protein